MKFSIIVPIYNVEKYLSACIESILCQTETDFEVILVDDGSPDKCPEMCDLWAAKDSRINVVHKINGGVSSARNVGLQNASGDYIIFLDGDDYWRDNNLLQNLRIRIETYHEEVILFGLLIKKEDGSEEITRGDYNLDIINQHNKQRTLTYLYKENQFLGSSCHVAVSRHFIETHNLRFKLDVTAEDFEWAISLLILSNHVGAIRGVQYVYVRRPGSITTTSKLSGIKGTMNAIEYYVQSGFKNEGISKFLSRIYLLSVMNYYSLPKKDQIPASKLLYQYLFIVKVAGQVPYYIFIKMFGFNISSFIIHKFYSIIR